MAANPAPMSVRELHRPRRVLIAGGGTAGWITAFLLRSTAPPDVTITVVDSAADAPALGAGESTLPGFRNLLRSAGIDEGEFFAEADATFRLGVRFRQWNPARDFWHPFGAVLGPSVLVTDWLRTAARDGGAAIDEVLDQGTGKVAAARLAPQSAGCPPYTGELRAFGYHADTARLADLVRDRAIAAGVRRVPDDVTDAEVGPGGWIRQVRTAAHGPLEADLFFDCTGFRGQLIRQALGEPFDPFSRHLWCDKAVTIDVPAGPAASADLPPYTVSTARSAGWIWEIPLYSRSCTGYVYSSAYLSPQEAETELRGHLGVPDDIPARHITMLAGKSRRTWAGNCIAVGAADGFIEPLDSTGTGHLQSIGGFLQAEAPGLAWHDELPAKLNAYRDAMYGALLDFAVCHYVTSPRNDTPFWHDLHHDQAVITPGIEDLLGQWHSGVLTGLRRADGGLAPFSPYSWAYIIGGNGLRPQRAAGAEVDAGELAEAKADLAGCAATVAAISAGLPGHRQRLRELRQAWQRGERRPLGPEEPSGLAYQLMAKHMADGKQALLPAYSPAHHRPSVAP